MHTTTTTQEAARRGGMHLSKPAALYFMHVYVHAYLYGVHPYASIMAAWGRNDVQNRAQYELVFVCV